MGRGRWERPALAERLSSVLRLLTVMHSAGLTRRTTLFFRPRQAISAGEGVPSQPFAVKAEVPGKMPGKVKGRSFIWLASSRYFFQVKEIWLADFWSLRLHSSETSTQIVCGAMRVIYEKGTSTRPVPGVTFSEVRLCLNPCWRPQPLALATVPPCRHLRRRK
jgi:hypothetical protein